MLEKHEVKDILANNSNDTIVIAKFFYLTNMPIKRSKNKDIDKCSLYKFNDKTWDYISDNEFKRMYYGFLKKYEATKLWKTAKINEVYSALQVSDDVETVRFDEYKSHVCLRNGILNTVTGEFKKHSEEFYFTSYIDIDYNVDDTEAPTFVNFLTSTFMTPQGVDKDTINNVIRIGGALLIPQNKVHQMFVFLGDGANGKSLLIHVLTMLFSEKNVSYMDLDILSSNTMERTSLINSRLNVSTETKSKKIDSEQLKKIICGEEIEIARKYKEPMALKPRTKIVIASNDRPYFNDTSHGINRRLFLMAFNNRFVPENEYEHYKNHVEKGIYVAKDYDNLLAKFEKEKSAILNMFLIGLKDLRLAGWQMKECINNSVIKREYKTLTDNLGTFLEEYYIDDVNAEMDVRDILNSYRDWHKGNVSEGMLKLSSNVIGKRIKDMFRVEPFRKVYFEDGIQKRATFYKIRLKTNDDEIDEVVVQGDES